MKRKIFSKLLMVALVIAAVGSFVSCKDYDDDINNLQKQIDNAALKSDLAALQTTLTSVQSTATKAATDATSALTKAGANADDIAALKTKAAELGTQIATAAQNATKGVEDAANAQAAADAAKTAAQEAKDAIAPAIEAAIAEATTKFNAAIGAKADTATVSALATKLAEAEQDIAAAGLLIAANATAIEALETKADDFETRIAALEAKTSGEGAADVMGWTKAITSLELVPSAHFVPGENYELLLLKGTEVDNDFGGAKGSKASKLQIAYQDGNALQGKIAEAIPYKAGDEIEFNNRIIVRVNPANAQLKAEDLVLINSLGEKDLNELVTFAVEDYDQLITRAENTGLKLVTIIRKASVTDDAIATATEGKKINGTTVKSPQEGQAMFALGTKSGTEDRYVYTTFDLGVTYGDYVPRTALDFYVKGDAANQAYTSVGNLKNRYATNGKLIGEDETAETPKAPYADSDWYPEFEWNPSTDAAIKAAVPSVDTLWVTTDGTKKNFQIGDARNTAALKDAYVVVDSETRSFTINMNPWNAAAAAYSIPTNKYVQYYYVVLDKFAAVESAPSEYEAWKKYDYTGLYTLTPATDPLKVTIDSESATGDIIGFRVFAVNYDGTLVDPDGRSFYVQVGTPAATPSGAVSVDVLPAQVNTKAALFGAGKANNAYKNMTDGVAPDYLPTCNFGIAAVTLPADFVTTSAVPFYTANQGALTVAVQTNKVKIAANGYYYLLQDAEGKKLATSWANFRYVGIEIAEIGNIVDGATNIETSVVLTSKDGDHHDKTVNKLALKFNKIAPNGPTNFSWKTGAPISGSTLSLFFSPQPALALGAEAWNVDATYGVIDFTQLANNLNASYSIVLSDANVLDNGSYDKVLAYEAAIREGKTAAQAADAADDVDEGTSVIVRSAAIKAAAPFNAAPYTTANVGLVNDGAWLLGIQGPAAAKNAGGTAFVGDDTYVDGSHTSGIKVMYKYGSAIALASTAATAYAPYIEISQPVSTVKFTYAFADNTYRAIKYQAANSWANTTAAPTTYNANTWSAASDKYVLLYDKTDMGSNAFQPAIVAPLLPTTAANNPVAWRWDADDAAVTAPGNIWTPQATYQAAGNRVALTATAGSVVAAPTAGLASKINLQKFVIVNNSEYTPADNTAFDPGMFTAIPEITFKSDGNGVNNEYYDATLNWAASLLNFAPKATPVEIPVIEVPATVVITGADAFAQEQVITLPFTIKK